MAAVLPGYGGGALVSLLPLPLVSSLVLQELGNWIQTVVVQQPVNLQRIQWGHPKCVVKGKKCRRTTDWVPEDPLTWSKSVVLRQFLHFKTHFGCPHWNCSGRMMVRTTH